jgi:hypothetical protein
MHGTVLRSLGDGSNEPRESGGRDVSERGVADDPSCVWRWAQAYAPELNKRCRPHLKSTHKYSRWKRDDAVFADSGGDKLNSLWLDRNGDRGWAVSGDGEVFRNHRPASRLQKPDEQRLWRRRFISGRVDLDRGSLSQAGLISERRPSFPKAINRKAPGLRRGLFLIKRRSAYLLTWIVPPVPPPRPGRAPPPLETSFTQSAPSPR